MKIEMSQKIQNILSKNRKVTKKTVGVWLTLDQIEQLQQIASINKSTVSSVGAALIVASMDMASE